MPFSPFRMVLLVFAILFLVAFVQVGIISIAFDKLGLSPHSAFLLLMSLLLGSWVNLPLFKLDAEPPPETVLPLPFRRWLGLPPEAFTGKTVVAVNVGGCLIPSVFSAFLVAQGAVRFVEALIGVAAVAAVSYLLSRPIAGVGIGMPVLVAPVTAAGTALLLDPEHSAPLAYVAGTLGVILGADVLHLKDIRRIGAPFAAIGGAGTFDGIFVTGIVAALLA